VRASGAKAAQSFNTCNAIAQTSARGDLSRLIFREQLRLDIKKLAGVAVPASSPLSSDGFNTITSKP
jgi:hypothetical protein